MCSQIQQKFKHYNGTINSHPLSFKNTVKSILSSHLLTCKFLSIAMLASLWAHNPQQHWLWMMVVIHTKHRAAQVPQTRVTYSIRAYLLIVIRMWVVGLTLAQDAMPDVQFTGEILVQLQLAPSNHVELVFFRLQNNCGWRRERGQEGGEGCVRKERMGDRRNERVCKNSREEEIISSTRCRHCQNKQANSTELKAKSSPITLKALLWGSTYGDGLMWGSLSA